ncbi:MAG: glycoside hydrolase family 32 protein [Acidobacteriota bacterium]|nr:glycoside hydrolase family 32 protein [Acidobacteriota bacterium]
MNDPNGPIYWNGYYHMFYQYNPSAAKWGDMHWAHALSPDMIHWRHLPIALSPNPNGPDRDGCFSGSTVIHNGVPTILYTGVRSSSPEDATLRDGTHNFHESQCLATSRDPQLRSWTASPVPVIANPPVGLAVTGFRDPCVWRDGKLWYMAIGSGFKSVGGAVLLYRSADLHAWEYLHPLIIGEGNGSSTIDPVDSGEMWECPDFFQLGQKYVLLYSTERKVYWLIGDFDRESLRFHPEKQGLLDTGAFYAPKSMLDAVGKRILWGWIPETRPEADYIRAGWAGVMALPRILSLEHDNSLGMRPLPSLGGLRTSAAPNSRLSFQDFSGEMVIRFARAAPDASIVVGSSSRTYLEVHYRDSDSSHITIDGKSFELSEGRHNFVEVHIFMDGSVVELFTNTNVVHTKRIDALDLDSKESTVTVSQCSASSVWQLRAISHSRTTG